MVLAPGRRTGPRGDPITIKDKIQAGVEKITNNDTTLTAAEVTTLQQAVHAIDLGLIKSRFYLTQTENETVRGVLESLIDDFIEPNMERPRRILEKSGIPYMRLNAKERVANLPATTTKVYRDEEILLDTALAMQATVTGLQAGALAAVRGDVRDFFLEARDAAMAEWRGIGLAVMQVAPQIIPPTMSGVSAR